MKEWFIGLVYTLAGAVLIGIAGYSLLKLFLSLLLVWYGRR
jgi:hypothetical protein